MRTTAPDRLLEPICRPPSRAAGNGVPEVPGLPRDVLARAVAFLADWSSGADPGWWQDQAACRGSDTDWFFPARGESVAAQKAACGGCAVRGQCLADALWSGQHHGIWGGIGEGPRRRLRAVLAGAGFAVADDDDDLAEHLLFVEAPGDSEGRELAVTVPVEEPRIPVAPTLPDEIDGTPLVVLVEEALAGGRLGERWGVLARLAPGTSPVPVDTPGVQTVCRTRPDGTVEVYGRLVACA